MQTIARANRRAPGKTSGVIVDYVGVFQNLQKALAIYATKETAGGAPIQGKDELVAELEEALAEARKFCTAHGVDVDAIFAAEKLARLTLIGHAVEALVSPDERRRGFFRVASAAARAYKALLPDERAAPYLKPVATLHVLAEALRGKLGPVDISALSAMIEALLDEKIEGVAITAPIIEGDEAGGRVDARAIQGLRVQPHLACRALEDAPAPTVFLDHVDYLFDGNREAIDHLLDYIAHLIQRPAERVSHALLITSRAKGIGKSTFGTILRRLVGEQNPWRGG
jgi:hypothetical protein